MCIRDSTDDELMAGHGTTEVLASIQPALWRTEVLG